MKKIVLSMLTGAVMLAATLGVATSCKKVDNAEKLIELAVLIAEGMLLSESEYTAETWTPFAVALQHAKGVEGSQAPTAEMFDTPVRV